MRRLISDRPRRYRIRRHDVGAIEGPWLLMERPTNHWSYLGVSRHQSQAEAIIAMDEHAKGQR